MSNTLKLLSATFYNTVYSLQNSRGIKNNKKNCYAVLCQICLVLILILRMHFCTVRTSLSQMQCVTDLRRTKIWEPAKRCW